MKVAFCDNGWDWGFLDDRFLDDTGGIGVDENGRRLDCPDPPKPPKEK